VIIFFNTADVPDSTSHLAGVHPDGVHVTQYNFVYFHNAPSKRYQIESSLTIP
jgi:hypothetical protein